MLIGIPREILPEERRVAIAPGHVPNLQKLGYDLLVESGAGVKANFPDSLYVETGAKIAGRTADVWKKADIILKIRAPEAKEIERLHEGQILICMLQPAQQKVLLEELASKQVTALALDAIPRISRAQSMDVLSSMANISGYRAVVEAAQHFGRFFTGQITAAGRIPPAKVLVIGAGVAGLAAIGASHSLGAIVRAFDTRVAVRDEVKSLGGEFLELDLEEDGTGAGGYAKQMSEAFIKAEMELFAQQAAEVDIIITTAAIPGRPSPKLITTEMVRSMKPGSVIVDLAAEGGGNCELTESGKVVKQMGVTIVGKTNLPSELPTQASQLYGNNVLKLLNHLKGENLVELNFEDEITRAITVTRNGEVTWEPPRPPAPKKPTQPETALAQKAEVAETETVKPAWQKIFHPYVAYALVALLCVMLGFVGTEEFLGHLFVFMLSCFVGYMVVWNVTPSLQTPLMSLTNAISGIIVLGGMMHIAGDHPLLAGTAILIATINIAGGFLVTQRMLGMFKK